MNHITFKDKEGFDINVLAFDGESNFAILDRTSTGSPTPYVVVKGLDTESATWSNSEGYFSNYEDCVRKYKSSVLEHTKSDIPMKAMFEYLLRRDIEPMLSCTLTEGKVCLRMIAPFAKNFCFAFFMGEKGQRVGRYH